MNLTWQHRLELWPFSVPIWLVALLLLVAGLGMIYAARAQRRAGVKKSVTILLATLRGLLLLLIFILTLRPAWAFEHITNSAGTLWLLVDQSTSMQTVDAQATPVEQLRWAAALGYVPEKLRPGHPDLSLARVQVLRQTLPVNLLAAGMGGSMGGGMGGSMGGGERAGSADAAGLVALRKQITLWQNRAVEIQKRLNQDEALNNNAGNDIRHLVTVAVETFARGVSQSANAASVREVAGAFQIEVVQTNLDLAVQALGELARQYDQKVLKDHEDSTVLSEALARVSGMSRAELLRELVASGGEGRKESAKSAASTAIADRAQRMRLKLVTFSDAVQVIPNLERSQWAEQFRTALQGTGSATTDTPSPSNTGTQSHGGGGTSLAVGMQAVAQQETGSAASAVFLTDGRQNVPGDPTEPARLLAARGIQVHGLLVGSEQVSPDAAADPPDAPEWVFKEDTVKITARLHLEGLAAQPYSVELWRDGKLLARQLRLSRAGVSQEAATVNFTDKPGQPGVYGYEIRVPRVGRESNLRNNQQMFRVRVKKDKMAVLLAEESPRWEYQFLAASLSRDPSLKLQTVLFSPARITNVQPPAELLRTKASVKNPKRDAGLLPETLAEWEEFDLIILGDLPPARLSVQQQRNLAAVVRDRGATLVLLAGANAMPQAYLVKAAEGVEGAKTNWGALGDLLPVEAVPSWSESELANHLREGFRPAISPEAGGGGGGGGSVLAQLHSDPQIGAQMAGQMPRMYFHSAYTQARPAAQVLWYIAEAEGGEVGAAKGGERKRALISTMGLGLGRVVYLASDQTWRLHNVAGYDVAERFWNQLVRWSAGNDLPAGGKFVRFGVTGGGGGGDKQIVGEPVTILARVLQEDLTPLMGAKFSARATQREGANSGGGGGGERVLDTVSFEPQAEAPGYYRATFGSLPAGTVEVGLTGEVVERLLKDDPTANPKTLRLQVESRVGLEERDVNTNPALLQAVTQAGGGVCLPLNAAEVLIEALPEQQEKQTSIETVGLFTDPKSVYTRWAHGLFLGLFALILLTEWVIRKRVGLI